MTAKTFAGSAMETAQIIATIPLLMSALIGVAPILLLCTVCRCCRGTCATLIEFISEQITRRRATTDRYRLLSDR